MSNPNDFSTYEKVANMKNLLGGSFIEILKQNIKSQQNENVIKMLDIAKDKPETYLELLAVAIFYQNFEIIKNIIEKFKITKDDTPYINALSIYNSLLKDNSKDKIGDSKDNYLEFECPFVIMSAIGGNIDIYKYLLSINFISNKNQIGFIGLSKKSKNAFFSNIIGACAYYGRHSLLNYLLQNNKNELILNISTTEKKSKKSSRVGFIKEYTGFTPCMLAIIGPSSDLETIDILKILNNFNCNFDVYDLNKDNLLHLAVRSKKIETIKFLVDELNLKNLINEVNKDGYTPLSLSKNLNNDILISYFKEKNDVDEKQIQENLKELIGESEYNQSSKKKQNKKNKKNKNNNIPTLLNTQFQESLKVEEKEDESDNRVKYKNINTFFLFDIRT